MKLILISLLTYTLSYASLDTIESFKADFTQSVTDDKNTTLQYTGSLAAQKPQNAAWHYILPIEKDVFIDMFRVTIVEPEIEQVIIRKVETKFDFFIMIKNAKKVSVNTYEAYYKETKFTIAMNNNLIESISYIDNFENNVKIKFSNQKQNIKIDAQEFEVKYSEDFDVVSD